MIAHVQVFNLYDNWFLLWNKHDFQTTKKLYIYKSNLFKLAHSNKLLYLEYHKLKDNSINAQNLGKQTNGV